MGGSKLCADDGTVGSGVSNWRKRAAFRLWGFSVGERKAQWRKSGGVVWCDAMVGPRENDGSF